MRLIRGLRNIVMSSSLLALAANPVVLAQTDTEKPQPSQQQSETHQQHSYPSETKQQPSAMKPPIKAKNDAEIIALVIALDENEINVANVAMRQKVDPKVLELARTIEQDHAKNRAKTQELAKTIGVQPKSTANVNKLRAKGKKTVTSLYQQGSSVEAAFVSEMVTGHQEALAMLDEFINTAKNEELKAHLTEARQHIAMHLQQAEQLETQTAAVR